MLYDLCNDPLEGNNQIHNPQLADIQDELRKALNNWMAKTSKYGKEQYVKANYEILSNQNRKK